MYPFDDVIMNCCGGSGNDGYSYIEVNIGVNRLRTKSKIYILLGQRVNEMLILIWNVLIF